MTVVVAAMKGNKAVIAADTLISAGDKKVRAVNFCKLLKFPNFIVGFAGDCGIYLVLRDFQEDKTYLKKRHMRMLSQRDALIFSRDILEMLKGSLACSPTFLEEDYDFRLLILGRNGIYEADSLLCVTENNTFHAIGSGDELALGAMSVLYDCTEEEDLSRSVKKSIEITCDFTTSCALPINLLELDIK